MILRNPISMVRAGGGAVKLGEPNNDDPSKSFGGGWMVWETHGLVSGEFVLPSGVVGCSEFGRIGVDFIIGGKSFSRSMRSF